MAKTSTRGMQQRKLKAKGRGCGKPLSKGKGKGRGGGKPYGAPYYPAPYPLANSWQNAYTIMEQPATSSIQTRVSEINKEIGALVVEKGKTDHTNTDCIAHINDQIEVVQGLIDAEIGSHGEHDGVDPATSPPASLPCTHADSASSPPSMVLQSMAS